jgi:hypothetical protein
LPIQPNRSHRKRIGQRIIGDVVDFERAVSGVAQDHVGFAGVAAEIPETAELPVQSHRAERAGIGDVVVADIIDLECARTAVAQNHVGGIAPIEAAEADELPIGSDRAEGVARQD